jgi:hypothetical protein
VHHVRVRDRLRRAHGIAVRLLHRDLGHSGTVLSERSGVPIAGRVIEGESRVVQPLMDFSWLGR